MLDEFYSNPDVWQLVVLDFDLSWHQGALEKSVIHGAVSGYLAPEQMQEDPTASTRHSSVDSFGLGMTLFFMISRRDPVPSEHQYSDWADRIATAADGIRGSRWHSLPKRFTRAVLGATQHDQSNRWDLSQVQGELQSLKDAHSMPSSVRSAELVAEEVVARSELGNAYQWDDDRASATVRLPSGLVIELTGDESNAQLRLKLTWSAAGDQDRKRVGKWLRAATDRSENYLAAGGWKILNKNVQLPHSMAMETVISVQEAVETFDRQSAVLDEVAGQLRFD